MGVKSFEPLPAGSEQPLLASPVSRRSFLAACGTLALAHVWDPAQQAFAGSQANADSSTGRPTEFQIACMTLPYSQFPLKRALQGIRRAGYEYVAWGTRHRENGEQVPVMPNDAPPRQAKELAQECRDMGLDPLMMFSMVYPEATDGYDILKHRLLQAGAAGIPQVLTFGHTMGDNRKVWIDRLGRLGPIARDQNVLLVIKQHGGATGTGKACAEIVREINDPGVMVNYDAGNVMDYLNVDPVPDIQECADVVRSFCIKDHRNWPRDQDCGPGLGEIDHYRLLEAVAQRGLKMPLCCENIFAPLLPRPSEPDQVDALARRAREFLEIVTAGLQV